MRLHTLHDRGPVAGRMIAGERRHMAIVAALLEQYLIRSTRFRQTQLLRSPTIRVTRRHQPDKEERD